MTHDAPQPGKEAEPGLFRVILCLFGPLAGMLAGCVGGFSVVSFCYYLTHGQLQPTEMDDLTAQLNLSITLMFGTVFGGLMGLVSMMVFLYRRRPK